MDNSEFFKDKRKRDTASSGPKERPKSKPKEGGKKREEAPRKPFSGNKERRSYNPNFSADNKPLFEKESKPRREFGDKPHFKKEGFGSDKPRSGGDKPRFSKDGDKSRSKDFRGDKPRFGEGKTRFKDGGKPRPGGDKPRFSKDGDKPRFGEDKPRDFKKREGFKSDFKSGSKDGSWDKKSFKKEEKTRIHGENRDGSYPTFEAPKPVDEVRLNRYIALSGRCSRRDADLLIRGGSVTVNDTVVTEMGHKIAPTDVVKIDGEVVDSEKKVYILMNKPKGFVTSLEDPHADKTVIDLLGTVVRERVYPVGRLDKSSVGVLLLTNDGDLTARLTHPSFNKKKVYQATLDRAMTQADLQSLVDGVMLEDGPMAADAADYVSENRKEIGIEIHSGRNRVVRRMIEHLGYRVTKLDRVYFAGLTKRNLKRGQWRFLIPVEVEKLLNGMYE